MRASGLCSGEDVWRTYGARDSVPAFSQRFRAGLNCGAPTALGDFRHVRGLGGLGPEFRFEISDFRLRLARPSQKA